MCVFCCWFLWSIEEFKWWYHSGCQRIWVSNVLFMVINPQVECNDVTICSTSHLSPVMYLSLWSQCDGDQSKCHGLVNITSVMPTHTSHITQSNHNLWHASNTWNKRVLYRINQTSSDGRSDARPGQKLTISNCTCYWTVVIFKTIKHVCLHHFEKIWKQTKREWRNW